VHPHILHGVELMYANTHYVYLDKLIKLNSKILRILQCKPLSTPVVELYSAYNTLPIVELHTMQLLILTHKYLFHRSTLPEVNILQLTQIYIVIILESKKTFTFLATDFHMNTAV
jgi:hypothetical protein